MKKLFLILATITITIALNAQTTEQLKKEIEQLKQENKVLQNKADFCELFSKSDKYTVKSFNENYKVNVLKVIGNKNEQTVDIIFTLQHEIANQNLTLDVRSFAAYDEMGNAYSLKLADFSGNKDNLFVFQIIPTDVLIQGKLTFRNILSKTDRLKKVAGKIETKNQDGEDNKYLGDLEFTNLLIDWK